jgi:hypothetical protein
MLQGQAPPLRVSQPRGRPEGSIQGGPLTPQAYYCGAPFGDPHLASAPMQPVQQFALPIAGYQQGASYVLAAPVPLQGYGVHGMQQLGGAPQSVAMQSSSMFGMQATMQGAPPGHVGSFFAQMRPPVANGPVSWVAPVSYAHQGGSNGERGGYALPPDEQQNQFQALRDQRYWRQ